MFGVGGQELVLLMIIGLVVLGPERLPRIANQLGGWLGQARRMTRVMKRQLEEELDLGNINNIKPPPPASRRPSQQPSKDPAADPEYILPRDDDEFSPEHAPDDPGTGVGDETYEDEADLAVSEAERDAVAGETNKRPGKDEQPAGDEAEEKAAS
jgi:sec-independent protein translocase protein TatB